MAIETFLGVGINNKKKIFRKHISFQRVKKDAAIIVTQVCSLFLIILLAGELGFLIVRLRNPFYLSPAS